MERPDLTTAPADVLEYITYLEDLTNGLSDFQRENALFKADWARDMELIRSGKAGKNYEKLKYICLDKDNPKFNLVRVISDNIKAMEMNKGGRPPKEKAEAETITVETDSATVTIEEKPPMTVIKRNPFEAMSEQVLKKSRV
jgi:hypothetical protein